MNAAQKILYKNKSLSWLLIVTILLVTLQPAHYHLHHQHHDGTLTSTAGTHDHAIDLHILTKNTGDAHHDKGTTIFAAAPDGIMKKSNADSSPFILLTIALLLMPVLNIQIDVRHHFRDRNFKQSYPHFTPLLRAPPLY